jgi:hypothetical protein
MNHAEIIAAADAEARRQGFDLVAVHAVPERQAAITLCFSGGYHPWAVHRFSMVNRGLNVGGYHFTRERALAEFDQRLADTLAAAAAA